MCGGGIKKKYEHNQNTRNGAAAAAGLGLSRRLKVRQQGVPWSPQEKKNRKQEELGDWLTFPVRAAAADPGAALLSVSDACVECGGRPGGCPRSRPAGRGRRAERRCPVGSPEGVTGDKSARSQCGKTQSGKSKGEKQGVAHLSVASDFHWLVFVPGIRQVSCFDERELPPVR